MCFSNLKIKGAPDIQCIFINTFSCVLVIYFGICVPTAKDLRNSTQIYIFIVDLNKTNRY
jgi:hypothetical protein